MVKKQLIMEKALELFAKQGFEATSVQQITELCGISKGAFYLSFKSKDELILSLIDHFMKQITSDIDYMVKSTNDRQLLYTFYYAVFDSFHKHSDFAKLLLKEQAQSFNEELLRKVHYYDSLMDKTILFMIDRLFKEDIQDTKYDLLYCIKGLMNSYSSLFIFNNVPLDLDLLAQSLVEKTKLLAEHTTIPFISSELFFQLLKRPKKEEVTKERILEELDQKIKEMEQSIEKESLVLLKEELLQPSLSQAIIKGLIENIRSHPHCKWVSYLLSNYFKF